MTDASVWFGSVLRGDNEWIELGERSQIQDNATLHTDPGFPIVIGRDCVIGHNVILHGAKVGDNSLIGMGAILLNGATIGKNSLVGAGALVTEGKSFPDGSLIVGAPARVIAHARREGRRDDPRRRRHLCAALAAIREGPAQVGLSASQKGAAASGGRGGRARTRSGDGEGWGRDRGRVTPLSRSARVQRDVAVETAGRWSPSATHTLGSLCDCRFTKR